MRYANRVYWRSGTLREGRFKSSLIDSERYLLICGRYIDKPGPRRDGYGT